VNSSSIGVGAIEKAIAACEELSDDRVLFAPVPEDGEIQFSLEPENG
jgi:hypothetical protein